jgi:hypothetical protein
MGNGPVEHFDGSTGPQLLSTERSMSDEKQSQQRSEADAELEREIREDRKFTLEEGIMRLAGPGMMNGESPVSRKQQSEAKIESYVRCHLLDAGGALPIVLVRYVTNGELFLANFEQPLAVLANCIEQILGSDYLLAEMVRAADAEWGRVLGERPYFEREGSLPHPDDPYTVESVRSTLTQLLEKVTADDAH